MSVPAEKVTFGYRTVGAEEKKRLVHDQFTPIAETCDRADALLSLGLHLPYMQDTRSFDAANAAPLLEKRRLVCPMFDYAMFSRCMDYAVETDWGSKLLAR